MSSSARIFLSAALLAFGTSALAQQDVADGQNAFEAQCALCHDASNGNTLYKFNTGGSVGGGVVTYEVGGKQYVATTSGVVSGFFGGSGTSAIIIFALH